MRSALTSGSLLAGRYRLQEKLADDADGAQWRAVDELLRRPVLVRCSPGDDGQAEAVIAAARACAALSDRRMLRVLDADVIDGRVVVVSEWVPANDLARLLEDGPLEPDEARRVTHEVACALAAAADQGLHHLRLTPEKVLRGETGQVKIIGLGVDAAASGAGLDASTATASAVDTEAVGALLYAALTGRWPLPEGTGGPTSVPLAPFEAGAARRPRQVRAGVPADLDEIAVAALGARGGAVSAGHGRVGWLRSPEDVAAALDRGLDPTDATGTLLPVEVVVATPPPALSGRTRLVAGTLLGAALAAVVALVGWQLGASTSTSPPAVAGSLPSARSATPTPPLDSSAVPVSAVEDLDPHGDGSENPGDVALAVDGKPSTAWRTLTYFGSPRLGQLKPGVGLVLDLGQRRRVRSVSFVLEGRGTDLALGAADRRSGSETGYPVVASVTGAGRTVTLRPEDPLLARYLLVWLTSLPQVAPGQYRGGVAEIVVNR